MTLAGLRQRPAYSLYQLLWGALDWVFPPNCGGCAKFAERWCQDCQAALVRLPETVCLFCGTPLPASGTCADCQTTLPEYRGLRSVCAYSGPARRAVIRLKYSKDIGLGEALSRHLVQLFLSSHWQIDRVTCVPLSRGRLKYRGYNQSAMLARPLAMAIQRPITPLLLRKTREAPTQVGLSANERCKNVDGAFAAGEKTILTGRTILVVDDVTTTGSTMNACARALKEAGAAAVYGLTFARAGLHDPIGHI